VSEINEKQLTKLYYSIGEVASIFDVNASLIRFWEKEFSSIKPKKNKKGNRLFTPKDIVQFDEIYRLVKTEGYTLDGAKKVMRGKKTSSAAPITVAIPVSVNEVVETNVAENEQVIQRLEALKSRLLMMKSERCG
jgi:DNA-binding transcriptional MerR regulator